MASLPIMGEGRGEGLLYATPITICGSYTLANNCRKNSVSFDGLTSFFSSAILDVLLSEGVESFIGRFAFTFSLSTINNEQKKRLLCKTAYLFLCTYLSSLVKCQLRHDFLLALLMHPDAEDNQQDDDG